MVKKSSSCKTFCLKRGSCLRPLPHGITGNEYYDAYVLVIVSSESIEPNDNDLEVNAVAYAFAKIFQPETC